MIGLIFTLPGSLLCVGAWLLRPKFLSKPLHLPVALGVAVFVWFGGWFFALWFAIETGRGATAMQLFAQTIIYSFWPAAFCYWLLRREQVIKVQKVTLVPVLAILGLTLAVLVLDDTSFQKDSERSRERQDVARLANEMVESMQSSLPIQINEFTKVIALAAEGNKVIYVYTTSQKSISQDDIEEGRESAIYNACNSAELRKLMDRGLRLSHIYKTESTLRTITKYEISKEDCVL